MFSQCFGLPERTPPTKEPRIASTNQCSDGTEDIDYSPAYTLQENSERQIILLFIFLNKKFIFRCPSSK